MADAPTVKYVLRPFEWNINTGNPTGLRLYLQEKKEIYKEADGLDISVSNSKEIIDNFPNISYKYGWLSLAFMVQTGAGEKNIFSMVEKIQLADIRHQAHGYFGLIGIGNVINPLRNTLVLLAIKNLATNNQKETNFHITGCAQIL